MTHIVKVPESTLATTYRSPSESSDRSFTYINNTEVTVLSEYLGSDCEFAEISSSRGISYIKYELLERLPTTPESAPYVCTLGIPNFQYVEPEWNNVPDNEPFYNQRTFQYCATVTTQYFNFANENALREQIIDKGLRQLLLYYNKQNDEETISKLKNYFIFANIKDIYVPYRRMSRIKGLLTVDKKYFDAVPVSSTSQDTVPIPPSEGEPNFVLRIKLSQMQDLFFRLARALDLYNSDIYFSNSTIGFNLNLESGFDYYNTSEKLINELSLSEKATQILEFNKKLLDLLEKNGFDFTEDNSDINKVVIEFAINDKCNKLYDIAVNNGVRCTRLRIGINSFIKSSPADDSTIISFIKNIHQITNLEKCKVPWPEFVETYVYPRVRVRNLSINDVIQNFEKNPFQYLKDLLQIFESIADEGQYYPGLTYEQTVDQETKIALLRSKQIFSSFKQNVFKRDLFGGDNSASPVGLLKFFNNLNQITGERSSTKKTKPVDVILDPLLTQNQEFIIVKKDGENYVDANQPTTYPKDEVKIKNPGNPNVKFLNFDGSILDVVLYETIPQTSKVIANEQQIINNIYDKLNQLGLCKYVDIAFGCISTLANDFIDINLDVKLATGVISNYNSEQMLELVKYLPPEQQEFVYRELLKNITCIKTGAILYILRAQLSQEEYNNYGFVNTPTYDKILEQLPKIISTSPQ